MSHLNQAVIARYGAWDVDEAEPIKVEISEPADSSEFVITVTDTGNGIPAEKASHMYDYFYSSAQRASLM